MSRRRHPDKTIEAALRDLEMLGWTVSESKGRSAHAWGFALCPRNAKDCRGGVFCRMSIWSTPRDAAAHARRLRANAQGCVYRGPKE
jgi:hypothetical protein